MVTLTMLRVLTSQDLSTVADAMIDQGVGLLIFE